MTDISQATAAGAALGIEAFAEAYKKLLHERPGILASESGGELAWLKKARERDAQRWLADGIPTKRQENWRYANLSSITKSRIVLPRLADFEAVAPYGRAAFTQLTGAKAAEIVFFNGQFVPEWSALPTNSGISVVVLSELFSECVNDGWSAERKQKFAAFRQHVETSDADRENVFAAMNTSFMQEGVLVYIHPKVAVREPIVVTYLSELPLAEIPGDLPLVSPRVFMHVDREADVSLIEVYSGRGPQGYFTNAVSDVRLDEQARLTYCKIQLEAEGATHIGTTRIHQKADSHSESFQFSFGGGFSRQDLHVGLEGEGAEAVLDGLYVGRERQYVDNHTIVDHVVPNTTSEQVYKGILADEAHAVFNGRVQIQRDAQKSNSAQLNNNLLLSPRAEIDTKPELEIDADDVKASHGATVGQIDPEHVFYLQTRGISRAKATKMLAKGFAQDIAFRISNGQVRTQVSELIDSRLENLLGSMNLESHLDSQL